MSEKLSSNERFKAYGGQAVIEGVMMRGSEAVAIAMRAPDNAIVIHTEALTGIYRHNWAKMPFLRGLVALWDAMGLGMRALTISANTQNPEEKKLEGPPLYFALALSLSLAMGLFFLGPATVGHLTESWLLERQQVNIAAPAAAMGQPGESLSPQPQLAETSGSLAAVEGATQNRLNANAWWGNLAEGALRLALLVVYVWAIGRMPEIARVFAYHGAEHKTINAFEAGAELTPENVSRYPIEHTRCGTAFLLTLVVFSILLFSVLGPMPVAVRLLSRILLLPVLASLAYEYIRFTARHIESPIVRALIIPNLALQRLTTRQPSLEMLEVSIAAFNAVKVQERGINL